MKPPPPPRKGQPITADLFNALRDYAISLELRGDPAGGVAVARGRGGTTVRIGPDGVWNIKLTSRSGNNYAWTLQAATPGGGWADFPAGAPRTGTITNDPAHEHNGAVVTTLNVVVRAYRDRGTNQLLFERSTCT